MNHIETIEIKNFKSIKHAEIKDCRRVNVFIGYPNVGKSNILEALGLFSLTQRTKKEHFSLNSICRLKRFSDLFFDKNTQRKVEIDVNKDFHLSVNTTKSSSLLNLYIRSKNEPVPVFLTDISDKFELNTFSLDEKFEDSILSRMKYYTFNKDSDILERKGTSLSVPDGDNLLDILHGNSLLRSMYQKLLSGYNLKLVIGETELSVLKELSDGSLVAIQHNLVSDTLRRLFFYSAAILTNKNSVLLFEEPEAHMFPPYIKKFTADVIFDETNQFFIATHSPFVLNEFIEEIADELAVYVVDYDKGETIIKRLTDKEVAEVSQYGVDLFFNLETYLDKNVQHSA